MVAVYCKIIHIIMRYIPLDRYLKGLDSDTKYVNENEVYCGTAKGKSKFALLVNVS